MKQHEISFESFQDGLTIKGTMLVPEHPIGILQIVHGMSEHHKRYLPLMEHMAKQGWICVAHDHRGHGESVRTKDDLGYFYDQSGSYVMEDVHQLTYLMKKQWPDLPYVLFGHSMGSLIVRSYIKKYDYELSGLIVCGSPSKNPMALAGQLLATLLAKIKGDHDRNALMQRLAFGAFTKKFPDEGSENAWICSDRSVVKQCDEDPACGFVFTLNGFLSLFHLMRTVYDPDDWVCLRQNLPILFIAGKEDPCITNEAAFKQAYTLLNRIGYLNVKTILYDHMRHEILNEQGKEQVFQDIEMFASSCLKQSTTQTKELVKG